ncbi:pyridoxamine 5'-phosphate oxidase family protein [Pseudanabaena sp. PCC 6802]|uniref:pyridoxamine 5'-phosphate oxidase family protein n=1 Tax=Pseudanabaena sp. PCC 6802 TaxID=118173 RepID=UPI000348F14D|nr:pyridoxamine 5'-phosphate oxidase family protein [Pseudanabaena sp. PCC 6802]
MAKFYPYLTPELREFIVQQHIFFVATAPQQGRINLSPKGIDTLRCLSDHALAYLDLTGSGNETSAHVQENGRITMMFCSFTAQPLILRLYGQGHIYRPRDAEWPQMYDLFPATPGARQIISIDIESVQTSCGFGVPLYDYAGEREMLTAWAQGKGDLGLQEYWSSKNQFSIDGLPTNLLKNGSN